MGAGAIPLQAEKAARRPAAKKTGAEVFTAPIDYAGADAVDVSFHGGHYALAPPKRIMLDYLLKRCSRKQFQEAYAAFLESSRDRNPYVWDDLLGRKRIVLLCSCKKTGHGCHRSVAIAFLTRLGAVYKGTLGAAGCV